MTTSGNGGALRIRQGHLAGPSQAVDHRVHAVRADLADVALAGSVIAPRYADGIPMMGGATPAMLHAAPDGVAVSELLPGEGFTVFDVANGWAWGQGVVDGYVGWVRHGALVATVVVDRRVTVPAALVFARPDIKAAVVARLPLNAWLMTTGREGDFHTVAGGFVHARHLAAAADPVSLARGFVGTPYRWGGRTRDGIDCSGLTQAVLLAAGIACPRDSDQQCAAFRAVEPASRRRGDLVGWTGHIGLLADPETVIHANARAMATTIEPLAAVVARLGAGDFHRPT